MKISSRILIIAIGAIISASIYAHSQNEAAQASDMPMMQQHGNMMMNSQGMQQMMTPEQHQNMHMMQQDGNMMMNPEMMQMGMQMMQTRMQHMQKMEQHMANIESLLAKILEAQKSN